MAFLVGVFCPQCSPDGIRNAREVREYLGGREPQNAKSLRTKPSIPDCVARDVVVGGVLAAIDLDDQATLETNEVNDIAPDRVLAPKARSFDTSPSQLTPESTLGITHRSAQFAGAFVSHTESYRTASRRNIPTLPLSGGGDKSTRAASDDR